MADNEAKPLSGEEEINPLKKKPTVPPSNGNGEAKPTASNPTVFAPDYKSIQLEVNLDDKPKDPKNTYNFRKAGFTGDILKQKSESEINNPPPPVSPSATSSSSSPSSLSQSGGKQSVEEVRAQMLSEEASEENKMSIEDYEDTADMVIDFLNMALVFGLRWVSMDTTDVPYEPPTAKIEKLKKHLTRYLIRMNKKFPMGILLLLAILAAYGTPARKAFEHRKLVLAEKAKKKKEKISEGGEEPSSNPLKKKKGGISK